MIAASQPIHSGPNETTSIRATRTPAETSSWAGDPTADRVTAILLRRKTVNPLRYPEAILEARSDPDLSRADRAFLDRFLDLIAAESPKFDRAMIESGQRVFLRNSVLSVLALLLGGLVETYARSSIANMLCFSGRSLGCPRSRLFSTAQLVYDLMRPGALSSNGVGVRHLVQIRLVHSLVRHTYRFESGCAGSSDPISQDDLVFTLLSFSLLVLRGLERLGVRILRADQEAYLYLWRCAAWYLGIETIGLPKRLSGSWQLYEELSASLREPDRRSGQLVRRSIRAMSSRAPVFLPEEALQGISRHLVGNPLADQLGLSRSKAVGAVVTAAVPLVRTASSIMLRHRRMERVARYVGWRYARRSLRQHSLEIHSS